MNFLALLETKRDGQALTAAQLREVVAACTAGQIPDYQLAAFLMAIYYRGLAAEETAALTLAMRDSGEVLVFPSDSRPLVDKHSTGGVGDKVSLPLAPLLACLGFRVPMISGRGLGITGGTLDKFDSIPGFRTSLTRERIVQIVQEVGCIVCGQTDRMVPADKTLYALRDVTGTVPSLPLIVASILSKKLAEGLDALVLDVKFGAAAFMPTPEKANELAQAMVRLGNHCGVNTRALVTRMEAPLGRAAGNWLEVKEAVACLEPQRSGRPPSLVPPVADVLELVNACAAQLLVQTGKAKNIDEAGSTVTECLASGAPRRKWDEMLVAQGGDLDAFNRKLALDHLAPVILELKAAEAGYVSRCNGRLIGQVVRELGGGRLTKDSVLDYDVGVDQLAKPGEMVEKGSVYARVHAGGEPRGEKARAAVASAFEFSAQPPALLPLIGEVVT